MQPFTGFPTKEGRINTILNFALKVHNHDLLPLKILEERLQSEAGQPAMRLLNLDLLSFVEC